MILVFLQWMVFHWKLLQWMREFLISWIYSPKRIVHTGFWYIRRTMKFSFGEYFTSGRIDISPYASQQRWYLVYSAGRGRVLRNFKREKNGQGSWYCGSYPKGCSRDIQFRLGRYHCLFCACTSAGWTGPCPGFRISWIKVLFCAEVKQTLISYHERRIRVEDYCFSGACNRQVWLTQAPFPFT